MLTGLSANEHHAWRLPNMVASIVARQHDSHDRLSVVTRADDGDDPNPLASRRGHQEKDVEFEVIRSGFAEDGRS
jgi:hypothetical protein